MSFDSAEITIKIVREKTDRARKPTYRMGQIIEYALSTDTRHTASATDQNRILVARLIERIEDIDRENERRVQDVSQDRTP